MSVVHVHSVSEYENLVNTQGKLVVVDFSATWCGPCKKIAPVYESMAAKYTDAIFLHVDVDELASLPECAAIRGVPTFKFVKNGAVVAEFAGANAEKLESNVTANL